MVVKSCGWGWENFFCPFPGHNGIFIKYILAKFFYMNISGVRPLCTLYFYRNRNEGFS